MRCRHNLALPCSSRLPVPTEPSSITSLRSSTMPSWVEDAVFDLLTTRCATIARQKAEWENWALLEVSYNLATTVPNSSVNQLQPFYDAGSQPSDIVVSYIDAQGVKHYESLELKCWYGRRDKEEFMSLVERDIDKVLTTTTQVRVRSWAMVLVVDGAMKDEVKVVMEGKRRRNDHGDYIDQVVEKEFPVDERTAVYLLSFLLPINVV
ncbi:hypothetical protein BKA70DRAFT_605533 [Coprinopsis sp. MPI-PUGE-AT-0042]|nr:hypothetical protein BKA70DRAFT_605533 [Coprinopsis sp. MPI-PUGE-AT-0042]